MQLPLFLVSHSITKEEAWEVLDSSLCLVTGRRLGRGLSKLDLQGEAVGLRGTDGSHNSEICRSVMGREDAFSSAPSFFFL